MPNEAPNTLQSGAATGTSPEPGEPPVDGERTVPVLLIIVSAFLMLVIFGFTHIDDLKYIHQLSGEAASARAGALTGSAAGLFFLPVIIAWLATLKVKPPRRIKLFAIVFAAVGILASLAPLAASRLRQRPYSNREVAHFVYQAGTPVMGKDVSALVPDFYSQRLDSAWQA